MAAMSVAARVSQEMGVKLGNEVHMYTDECVCMIVIIPLSRV